MSDIKLWAVTDAQHRVLALFQLHNEAAAYANAHSATVFRCALADLVPVKDGALFLAS
jgi:hypothetical protein